MANFKINYCILAITEIFKKIKQIILKKIDIFALFTFIIKVKSSISRNFAIFYKINISAIFCN